MCTANLISGWVWDSDHPERRITVQILVDGKPLARVTAQQYRQDLKDARIGAGTYAFWYTPVSPIGRPEQAISVVVAGTDICLHANRSDPVLPMQEANLASGCDGVPIDTASADLFSPAAPWPLPPRSDCDFYHCMDFPGGESIEDANWDFRGRFESYIGGYPIHGRTLLDVGTASGFLAFSAEEAGAAHVTAIDALHASEFQRISFKDSLYTKNRLRWIADTEAYLNQLKNSFWYAWHKKSSSVEVIYTPASRLWRWNRKFDVVIAGAIVEHMSDPVTFISSLAGLASEAVIIAFTPVVDSEEQFMQTLNAWDRARFNYSWWILSKGLYTRIFGNLGFSCEFMMAAAKCNEYAPPIEVQRPSIIARRQAT